MPEVFSPLDLETIFVNVLAGGGTIFVFLMLIFTSFLAARFRMPSVVYGIMLVLLTMVLNDYMGGLYIFALVIVSMATYFTLAKVFDR